MAEPVSNPLTSDALDGFKDRLRIARTLRYAVGVTLALILAYSIEWPLAFLVPVLTAVLLAMPLPMPNFRAGLTNMLYTLSAFFVGAIYTLLLLPFPLVYVPMLGLAMFNIYYLLNRGGPFWFVLMALLAILILPMLGNTHEGLSLGFAIGFIISGWITVIMIWVAHALVPDPPGQLEVPGRRGFQPGYSKPAAFAALKSTLVVLPLTVVFIIFDWSGQLFIMIFAAILSLSPEIGKGKDSGLNSVISTLIGGTVALAFYWAIVAVPVFHFFIALMFLTCLVFGAVIFSDSPLAKYFGSAFVALFILVNSSLGENSDLGSAFVLRILFICLATLYVMAAMAIYDHYLAGRKQTNPPG